MRVHIELTADGISRFKTLMFLVGCLDVICSDKTGTLTMNDMTVSCYRTAGAICNNVLPSGGSGDQLKDVNALIEAGVVCNNAAGATEKALLAFGAKNGLAGNALRSQVYSRQDSQFVHS